jgi:aminoglycoside phosphotransferase (APT) family kinase protein
MENIIKTISLMHFGVAPSSVKRFTIGLCNEVYEVVLSNNSRYVFRLNKDGGTLRGSEKNIPAFASLGVKVPKIICSDYSLKTVPYNYQILLEIPGKDLGEVFESLSKAQLSEIADEVAKIFDKVATLSTDGSFGYTNHLGHAEYKSWTDFMKFNVDLATDGGRQTGTLTKEIEKLMVDNFNKYEKYFDKVESKSYFGDIASKNVLVNDGKFSGLVDLDVICYGDYLEAVGRIKADFFDRKNGEFYTEQIIKRLGLTESEKKVVDVYALLNRIFWSTGNGIQFNQNSSAQVDQERLARDHKIIWQLKESLVS